jgi:endonuclease/exonuclease/phosphatase family metal-dependent hydrolase
MGCLVFLIACLSPYINPDNWPIIGFLALLVPYLVVALLFSIIFWLIVKPVLSLLPFITLLLGWKQLAVIVAWHAGATFTAATKTDSTIRLITWNVRGMYGISTNPYKQQRDRLQIFATIRDLNPDIVCLQEFNTSYNQKRPTALNLQMFGEVFPYHYFSKDYVSASKTSAAGSIIFSKHPIVFSDKIKFPGNSSESLLYADIAIGRDTIRSFTTHLQSYKFNSNDYADIEKIKSNDADVLSSASENIYSKMKLAFQQRAQQSAIVREAIKQSPYPSIVCGDFNDVPNSNTYFTIRGPRQDAFLVGYFGIGTSFDALAPTLRIDYILPDNHFNILQFDMVDEGLSDHHMLVTDVSLKK